MVTQGRAVALALWPRWRVPHWLWGEGEGWDTHQGLPQRFSPEMARF